MNKTYYEILGISTSCSVSEIKQAYREKLLTTHPDKVNNSNVQQDEISLIKEAYRTLIDSDSRINYDKSIISHSKLKGFNINGGGLDLYSLEDFDFDEDNVVWSKTCPRCQFPEGIKLSETELEQNGTGDNQGGYDIIVQCNSCSLWIQVKYYDAV
ncbi:Diphthamide biosynthesis protein 4 [Spathaspora sp. JA1]|nr:Diphthamide biosynthesis protein 4 [Spathaspora sp. JA1]